MFKLFKKQITNENDSFFKPKNMLKRDEKINKENDEIKRKHEKINEKILMGLENIKVDYKNKNYVSENEKAFLKTFSKSKIVQERVGNIFERNNDYIALIMNMYTMSCIFYIAGKYCCVYEYECNDRILELNHTDLQLFFEKMFKKYFCLDDFECFWNIMNTKKKDDK